MVAEIAKQQRTVLGLDIQSGVSTGEEEWSHFQSAFHLIRCCGEMFIECEKLNSDICRNVSFQIPAMKDTTSQRSPFGSYNYLAQLASVKSKAVIELIAAIEQGIWCIYVH